MLVFSHWVRKPNKCSIGTQTKAVYFIDLESSPMRVSSDEDIFSFDENYLKKYQTKNENYTKE
mgnify:CR=1 FL=1